MQKKGGMRFQKMSIRFAQIDMPSPHIQAKAGKHDERSTSSLWGYLFQDGKLNSPKIKCFLILFRLASYFEYRKRTIVYRLLYWAANAFYCLYADFFLGGAELPAGTQVGKNLTIHHGYGLVIGKEAVIKDNVVLRQGVTIGNYVSRTGKIVGNPVIESSVEFGAGACVLGKVTIGEQAFIGANAVVFKDVPAAARVYPGLCTVRQPASLDEEQQPDAHKSGPLSPYYDVPKTEHGLENKIPAMSEIL